MTVVSTKQALINKLDAMVSLKAAYGFETTNPDGKYPFATVTLGGGEGEFRSTASNLRRREFIIRVYQEQTEAGQGNQNAEVIMANVIDELEQALDMDTTLSGMVKFVDPIDWIAEYADRETDVRLMTITVRAYDLVSAQ